MTDPLRDVLTRVADRAGPVSVDPLLWSRASRTRRRRQGLAAGAILLVVVALLGGIVVSTGALRTAPPPAERPEPHDPIEIRGIEAHGGLRIERDLAVGRATVAIVNDTAAFVVTADDGVVHRIALPGFDPSLNARTASPEGVDSRGLLSLSPDGTKLIYAWHEPFVPQVGNGPGEPGEGWVEGGARLLDLTTGAVDTYPSGPDDLGVTTQLGRSDWHFRWSPNSQLVAFYEGAGPPGEPGEWWGGLVLDTTQKVTWTRLGPQTNPRGIPGMNNPGTAAPAINDAGMAGWVDTPVHRGRPLYPDQTLMTGPSGSQRPQPLPDDVAWGGGRFSPDGQALLLEPAGVSDRMLAVHPRRAGTVRRLRMTGDLPGEQVRTELLGWVGADQVLAAVHRATGTGTWEADADLALLTVDLDAWTADAAVVGRVDPGSTGSAFSYATDLLAADLPTKQSGEPVVQQPGSESSGHSSTLDRTGLSDRAWLALGSVGLALGAASAVMILRRKRS